MSGQPISNRSTRGRRIRRVAAAVTIAGAAVAAMASPASAEQTCNSGSGYVVCFDLTRLPDGNIAVHLGIDVTMSRQDAQAIIDSPGEEFSAKVYGDDPVWDNAQVSVPVSWSSAWDGGLSAEMDMVATFSQLNEDDGYFDGYIDELYGQIRLFDPRTQRTRTFTSNVISGYY
jgi:hypothetical protein